MPHIGENVLTEVSDMLKGNLFDYQHEIEEAFCRFDDSLSVSLGVKFSMNKEGIKAESSISFKTDEVKDKSVRILNENQKKLPLEEKDRQNNRERWRKILFRNFDGLRRALAKIDIQRRWKQTGVLFKRF